MKRFHLAFILLSLIIPAARAQKAVLPPPYVIVTDTATSIDLPYANWQFMMETKREITFKEATAANAAYKTQRLVKGRYYNNGKAVYWVRLRLVNGMNYPLGITFSGSLRQSDVYIADSTGKWQHFFTGSDVPWSKRDGLKRINAIPYTIAPHDTITVYKRNMSQYTGEPMGASVGILKNVIRQKYIENDKFLSDTVIQAALFGFLAFAAIFNFFFFYTVREKVYLLYGILLLLAGFFCMTQPMYFLNLREYPQFIQTIAGIELIFIFYLAFMLSAMFMQTAKNHPRWNRVLFILSHCFAIVGVPAYLLGSDFPIVGLIVNIALLFTGVVITIGIMVNIVADMIKKRFATRLFMLAVTPFLISSIMVLITAFLVDNLPAWIENITNVTLLWTVIVLSWSLFDRYKGIQNENALAEQERIKLIAEQNERLEQQVTERTAELNRSLNELKQTQSQLIQSEKMASLGELTAGIAHEIQNPLNFVNNFSEVSVELLDELEIELTNGDKEEALAIASDVKQNLEKIHHHGKRADSIVKGMLQHSRATSGQKEPTDLNKLADEYLRLAYHGLRAKDKSFNAELITAYDETLPPVNIIPQDIGRVFLNLLTNAFYATQQKAKTAGPEYKPTVTITTSAPPSEGGGASASVRDNGTGIPDNIKDKILQPFFTTKPTGEGTGLGLSLTYDIVVKGHGGKIEIESKEGEYTEFTISFPAKP